MKWTIGRNRNKSAEVATEDQNEQRKWREYKEDIQAGHDYRDLTSCSGWKRLMSELEWEANLILGTMRASESTDPEVIRALWLRWKMFEQVIDFMNKRPSAAIERATQLLSGPAPQDPSHLDMSDEEDIRRFMKSDPVFDQFDEEGELNGYEYGQP